MWGRLILYASLGRAVCAPWPGGYEQGVEHDEQADRLEREADKLEQESSRVGDDIEQAKREWEQRQEDSSVPGAQPSGDEEAAPAVETDPERVSEEEGP